MNYGRILEQLVKIVGRENVLENEPMYKHTTMKVGGNADIFIYVKSSSEVEEILNINEIKEKEIPVTIIGMGANTICKDGGVRGIVLKYEANNIELIKENDEIFLEIEAGAKNFEVGKFAYQNSLTGYEQIDAIPGTVGGAIVMNAGSYGREMKDILIWTEYFDLDEHKLFRINKEEHKYNYRNSCFEDGSVRGIILKTRIKLENGQKEEIKALMDDYILKRKTNHPLEYPNCGSTFKRGEGFITSQAIDQTGLKGLRVGGAMVSEKHAGFLINYDNASAKDILELVELVKEKVKEKFGYIIKPEVRIIGDERVN